MADEYEDFDKVVTAVLSRPKTQSVLRIEIHPDVVVSTSPNVVAQKLIKEYEDSGFEFDGYELRVN